MLFLLGRGAEYWVIKVDFVVIVDRVPGRGLSSPLISQGCPREESAAALGVFCPPSLHGPPAVGSSAVPCPVPSSSPTALVPLPLKRNRVGAETSAGLFASCVSLSRCRPFIVLSPRNTWLAMTSQRLTAELMGCTVVFGMACVPQRATAIVCSRVHSYMGGWRVCIGQGPSRKA